MRRCAINILAPLLLGACLTHPAAAEEFWLSAELELDPAQQYQTAVFQLQNLRDQSTLDVPARLLRQDRTAEFQICGAIELRDSGSFRVVAQVTDNDGEILTFPIHDKREFDSSRIDVVLVIDASASMRETDPDNLRITAVRRFIELARHSERIANIALVAFQTESEVLLSLTPPNEIGDLKKYLRRLKPSASTNFDKAFNDAHGVLQRSKESRQAVLFLSDGSVKKYRETHRKFNQLAAPVHSIGLSEEADKQLLSRIAGESNGQFFDAPTADQLNGIFVQVFHLLDEPDVVARRIHAIPSDNDFEFHIDPTMDNVIVRLVPVSGRHAARFNGKTLYHQDDPKLIDYAVPGTLKGPQRIEFDGDGKSGCEIIAATDLKLRTVQLVREAPIGTGLEAWACLLGSRRCDSVETICELRNPDGTTTAVTPAPPDVDGFTRINVPRTQMPGQYRLEIQVTGTVDGQTFARTANLHYDRHGTAEVLSSDMDRVGPELRPIDEKLETDRVFDTTNVEIENIEASSLTTTYWASAETLTIGPLYPGQSGEATVELQISSVSSEALQAWLEQTSAPGITLQLDGDVQKNQRIALTVQAAADRVSAGRQCTTAIALSLGDLEWRIPLHVMVAEPHIVAMLSDSQITESPRAIDISAVMQVSLDPAGEGDLEIATDIAGLQIDTPKLAATALPVPVRLGMRLAVPLVRNEWVGTITVTGERLEPVEVPYRIKIDRHIEPIADDDSGTALPDIVTSQYAWWWLLVLFAVLLVFIILAAVRGNRRAMFLLASLAIHAAVLLLIMPRVNPNEEDQAKAPVVTTMTISSDDHVHEERIKSEVTEFEPEKETPDEAEAAKQELEIEDEVTDETQELEVEETLEPTEMTEELEAAESLEREDIEVEEIETEVEEIERVQEVTEETEADEQTPTEVELAEAEIAPEQDDAKELEVEETLTELEETADTQELEMEIERQDLQVEEIETEVEKIERVQEVTEETEADEQTPIEVEIAEAEITPEQDDAKELEVEETLTELEETADTQELEMEIERQDLQVEEIETEVEKIERVQEVLEKTEADEKTPTRVQIAEAEITPEQEDAKELEVEETLTELKETADTQELEMELERQDLQVEEIETEVEKIERVQEIVEKAKADEQTPTRVQIAEAEITPVQEDAKELEVEETLTELKETADTQELEMELERQDLQVEELETEAVEIARMQAAAADEVAAARMPTVVEVATAEAEATTDAAQNVEVAKVTPVETAVAATRQAIELEVERQSVETAMLQTQIADVEKKQANAAPTEITGAVQSSQTAATVHLSDTSTAARQMTVTKTPADIASETRPTMRNIATGVSREGIETEELVTQLTTAQRKSHQVATVEGKAATAPRVKPVAHQANTAELATTAAVFAPAAMNTTTTENPGAPQNVITPITPEGATAPVDLAAAPTEAPMRKAVPLEQSAGTLAQAIAGAVTPAAEVSAPVAQDTSDTSRRLDITGKAPPAADAAQPKATLQDLGTTVSKAPQRPSTAATVAGKLPPSTVSVPARRRTTATESIGDDELGAQARIGNPLVGAQLAFSDPSDVHELAIDATLPPVDFDFAPPALIPPLQVFVRDPGQRRAGGKSLVPLVQYSGDWDCDKTAMVNLADQLERRTGSIAPFSSNVVELDSDEVHDAPFIFMTGHNDFQFTEGEVKRLREYLKGGGYLWINDSTHEGEDAYDIAVRREMKRVFNDIEMTRLPKESNLFKGPYDLTKGYKGYKYVLPGDKYRQDYLEQLIVDRRTAVIYTRNDYGDGLEIDPNTHPLMGSLTDLSPAEMQESSVRMGINIVMFFYSKGGTPDDALRAAITGNIETAEADQWASKQELPFPLLRLDRRWQVPEGWEGLLSARPVYRNDNGIIIDFRQNPVRSTNGSEKAVIEAFVEDLQIANDRVLLIDVKSSLNSGARLAIALIGKGEDSYVESSPAFIRPGKNDDVSFDFRAGTFKTVNSNWEYKATVPIPYEMANWFFIVYPMEASGKVEINNVRMIKP